MSNETAKSARGRRLLQKNRHIARQVSIRKAHAFSSYGTPAIPKTESPHRYHKKSGTTCGDSNCAMCGNPRKFFKEPTLQEKRFNQDLDHLRNRHSNGDTSNE